jgi:HK97 gp10 family phage protein
MAKSSVEFKSYVAETMKLVREGNENALIELGINIVSTAKQLAPVDFGQVRNSISWKTSKSEGGFSASVSSFGKPAVNKKTGKTYPRKFRGEETRKIEQTPKAGELYVGSAAKHAIYPEFGTRNMRPKPFMRPAINKWTKGINEKLSVAKFISLYVSAKAKKEGSK